MAKLPILLVVADLGVGGKRRKASAMPPTNFKRLVFRLPRFGCLQLTYYMAAYIGLEGVLRFPRMKVETP
jgi:hypothetical protein